MKCSPTKVCHSERRMCENQQSVLSSVPWTSLLISSEVQWQDGMHRWRGHLCLNKAVPHFENTTLKNVISIKHSSLFVHLSVTSVRCSLLSAFVCLGLLSCNHLSTCMGCLSCLCLWHMPAGASNKMFSSPLWECRSSQSLRSWAIIGLCTHCVSGCH